MSKRSQSGSTATVVVIVVLVAGLIASSAFALLAYKERQTTRQDLNKLVAKAVADAETVQAAKLKAQFGEEAKSPIKTYAGPSTYGSVSFNYPKTWSGYVDQLASSEPINGYFHPAIVPGLQSKAAYALRVELVTTDYTSILQQHDSQIKDGSAKASAYVPPKMAGVANVQPGTRLDGALDQDNTGSMVIIKVRDKTLQIYTESNDFLSDFNNTVLPSLTFAP
ncbi:MAG: hypothetical protein Q7R60_00790 [bacterium]|nr:hypothetical protein [bacterium]